MIYWHQGFSGLGWSWGGDGCLWELGWKWWRLSGPLYPKLSTCFEGAQLTQLVQLVTAGRLFLGHKVSGNWTCCIYVFLELLFSYVSSQFPSMFSLTNLFSIIPFLVCWLPETLKMKEKQDLIELIQEQSKISFYNLRISQDSQTDQWIHW